jgi:DNA-binding transcriptional MerR regulator
MEKYTVIELSEKLNVPRTTITDWLTRYEAFIEYKVQGKRRIYTDRSVEVLSEIKELRDKGFSSFDIEEKLSGNHPIHGELSDKTAESNPKNTGDDQEKKENGKFNSGELVPRQGVSEMSNMLRGMLIEMTKRMDELEHQSHLNASRARKWNIISFSMILVFAAVALVFSFIVRDITEEKESEVREKQRYLLLSDNLTDKLKDSADEKKELYSRLDEIRLDKTLLKTELEAVKGNIEEQKKGFEAMLEKSAKESEKNKNAEELRVRDEFAKERLLLLGQLENARHNKEEMFALLAKLQAQCYEQEATIKMFSEEKEKQKEKELKNGTE